MLFRIALAIVLLSVATSASGQMKQGLPGRTFTQPGTNNYIIDFTEDPRVKELWDKGILFDDGALVKNPVNLVWDSRTHRIYAPSASFTELRDPVDESKARTPETGPDGKYLTPCQAPWTLIGQNGARSWGRNGPMHYGAGTQYFALGNCDGTIVMCQSVASGKNEPTRYSGMNDNGQHLVPTFCLTPDGDVVFNYNTNPRRRPKFIIQDMDLYVSRGFQIIPFDGDAWRLLAPDAPSEIQGLKAMELRMLEMVK